MAAERNWSDTHTFAAERLHRPESLDEVRHLVASERHIHAVGARHSFNGIADSEGAMIDLGAMPALPVIDRDRMTVAVGANTLYGTLAAWLETQGYALHNMASLPHVSVMGAIATGTHGSGDTNGILGTAVAALELVTAEGDVVRIRRGDDGFAGMVVGLGAFGVVTRVTLDIQPSYLMRQDSFVKLPWQTVLEDFDAVFSAGYSVSILTKWANGSVDRLWPKTRLEDAEPREVTAAHLGAIPGPAYILTPGVPDPSERLNLFGVAGPWSERLTHSRPDRPVLPVEQIQSEYMVPRTQAVPAIAALLDMGARIDPLLLTSEIRSMAADDLWLSPAYGHDAVALHFTWQHRPAEIAALSRQIEDMLLPLGGRPHWGKLMHTGADRLAPLYPRMGDFRALAGRWDPQGKFRNVFLERHVFG
jgi:xylitol oxidase